MPELPEAKSLNIQSVNVHGKEAVIIQALENREFDGEYGKYSKPHLVAEFPDKVTKDWYPDKTSQKECSDKWGTNTDVWVGKKVSFEVIKKMNRGELKDALFGKPSDIVPGNLGVKEETVE